MRIWSKDSGIWKIAPLVLCLPSNFSEISTKKKTYSEVHVHKKKAKAFFSYILQMISSSAALPNMPGPSL